MRSARWVLALFVGLLGFAANSPAVERTAYAVDAYGNLESAVISTSPFIMQFSTVADLDNYLTGSTRDSDGRLLTMFAETNELVSIDLETLEYEILLTLAFDVWGWDDLVFGPSGELLLLHWATSTLYEIDPDTGGLTLLADFDEELKTIEYHQGAYYAGNFAQFWRIDPVTFEATLIRDYSTWITGCSIWGLASIGNTLWYGYSCYSAVGPGPWYHYPIIGTIDPGTGDCSVHGRLEPSIGLDEDHHTLEIVERIVPIPALHPSGVVILVGLLGLVGTLAIRRL